MIKTVVRNWESKRTKETRMVEDALQTAGFEQVDAYRYNSASIRVRVIDSRFEGLPAEKRDRMVETHLDKLPERTQADIVSLFTFAPSEIKDASANFREFLLNQEFEKPSQSKL